MVPVTDAELEEMILAHEGGIFTDHPADHGGPTKWGITIPVLSASRGYPCSAIEIRNLSREEAAGIYRRRYIRPYDGLINPVRANVIDMAVNAGCPRATRLLQQAIGARVDGAIGPETRRLASLRNWNDIYVGFRLAFYESLVDHDPTQAIWRNGWRTRALSFFLEPRVRLPRIGDAPVYGFMGKAA